MLIGIALLMTFLGSLGAFFLKKVPAALWACVHCCAIAFCTLGVCFM